MKVSIIIPVFNERETIRQLLDAVQAVEIAGVEKEIIIVDDHSTDGTRDVLRELEPQCIVLYQPTNKGKGSALRAGYARASGEYVLNQDADLEYDPRDYAILLEPILQGTADIVFGSRRMASSVNTYAYRRYLWGGVALNAIINMIAGTAITDIFSGSKVFPRSIVPSLALQSDGFEIETELTIKLSKTNLRLVEVPISYVARTIEKGKKIRPYHAFSILRTAIKSK